MKTPLTPMFFLPWKTCHELWGAPKGIGIFKFAEQESGVTIPLSAKTLRKIIRGEKVTNSSIETLLEWNRKTVPSDFSSVVLDRIDDFIGMRLGEVQWRLSLLSLRMGEYGKDYGHTIDYIFSLLDQESESFSSAQATNSNPGQQLYHYCSGDFSKRYCQPITDELTEKVVLDIESSPEWAAWITSGMISLQMDIIARAEVEFYERNKDKLPVDWPPESRIIQFLPELVSETSAKIETILPIEKFFRFFRERLGYSSWEELARFVPMKGEADLSSQTRTLIRWVKEKHVPNFESVTEFFNNAAQNKGTSLTIDLLDIYAAIAFMTRMINKVLPELSQYKVGTETFIGSFQSYREHFNRHMAAATKRCQQPESTY